MRPSLDKLKLVSLALPVAGEAGAIYIFSDSPQALSMPFLKFLLTTRHNPLTVQQLAIGTNSTQRKLDLEETKDTMSKSH